MTLAVERDVKQQTNKSTKRVQSPDHQNSGIFVSYSMPMITVLRVEKLSNGMTLMLQIKCHGIFCANFTEEQQLKIKHRLRYVRKQKVLDPCNTSKEDDLDLLGDDVEAFSGSQADLEGAADNLFSSPHLQPLHFESVFKDTSNCPTNLRYCIAE